MAAKSLNWTLHCFSFFARRNALTTVSLGQVPRSLPGFSLSLFSLCLTPSASFDLIKSAPNGQAMRTRDVLVHEHPGGQLTDTVYRCYVTTNSKNAPWWRIR